MWGKLTEGWKFTIMFICIVSFVGALSTGLCYLDNNGIRTGTDDVSRYEMNEVPAGIQTPIQVNAYIEYRSDYIKSSTRYVDFCDVKVTRKEMRKEMRVVWKEMKEGCVGYDSDNERGLQLK